MVRKTIYLTIALCASMTLSASAAMVEFVEDAYAAQAPQELVNQVNAIAQQINFEKKYEVVVPKKAGLQINPWNRFIGCAINPVSHNWFIIVNPAWFATLDKAEQDFLIARCFMIEKHGSNPWNMKLVKIIYAILELLLAVALYMLLGKTRFAHHKAFVRAGLALGILIAAELLILDKIELKILTHLAAQDNALIHREAIAVTGNRDIAIKALNALDAGIKAEVANGETMLAPFKDTIGNQAKDI
jgi:hypothetical protein